MKPSSLLLILMLMSAPSFAEDVYAIPEGQLETAIADGKLTLEEFGFEGSTSYFKWQSDSTTFSFRMPYGLEDIVDLSQKIRVVSLPDDVVVKINNQETQDGLLPSNVFNLNADNSFTYSRGSREEGSYSVGKETYLQFQPLLEIEPIVPPNLILNEQVGLQVRVTNIGKSRGEDISISLSPKNAQASTTPLKQRLLPGEPHIYLAELTPTSLGEVDLGSVSTSTGASAGLGTHIVSEDSSEVRYSVRPAKPYFEAGETPTFNVLIENLGPYPVEDIQLTLWRGSDISTWELGDLLYPDELINRDIEMSALSDVEDKTRFTAKLSYTTDQQLKPTEREELIWVYSAGGRLQTTIGNQTLGGEEPSAGSSEKRPAADDEADAVGGDAYEPHGRAQQATSEESQSLQSNDGQPVPTEESNALTYALLALILALAASVGYLFMQQQKLIRRLGVRNAPVDVLKTDIL